MWFDENQWAEEMIIHEEERKEEFYDIYDVEPMIQKLEVRIEKLEERFYLSRLRKERYHIRKKLISLYSALDKLTHQI
ncbi:hypothetical protein [Ammoniphilus sp. 3BR4]|uniref:hypothetical protein n=1 Tax=Ammoniphilus sp. 3BR4 TaxID=3158265 RepID=UPI0034653DBD